MKKYISLLMLAVFVVVSFVTSGFCVDFATVADSGLGIMNGAASAAIPAIVGIVCVIAAFAIILKVIRKAGR